MDAIQVISAIGFFIALYAYSVEHWMVKDKTYTPLCDISENISCTRAFGSSYGHTFVLANSVYGMLFYAMLLLLDSYGSTLVGYLPILALPGTLYLMYISYIKMKNFCLVCTGIYVVNILLFIVALGMV